MRPTRRIRLGPSFAASKRHETVAVSPKQNQKPKSSKLHRLPFFVWVVLIFFYCYMVCMHRSFLRMSKPYNANTLQLTTQQQLRSTPTKTSQNRIVHVIQTRFMQHQSNLLELGFARLALFEAFCLPSILAQTSQNFVWIIRVDPNLNDQILGRMRQKLKRENILLLGSNHNPEGMGRDNPDFDHFLGLDRNKPESTGMVFSGNITLVKEAFEVSANSGSSVLLETRLDADDALHKMFVEIVQNQARQYLMRNYVGGDASEQLWRMWCIHSNVEWHPLNPYPVPTDETSTKDDTHGFLLMYSDKSICATPGLTFGYGFGATRSSILEGRRLKHNDIVETVAQCDNRVKVKCASRLNELLPGALRARTATSAGMANIITGEDRIDQSRNGLKQKKASRQLIQQFFQQEFLWEGVGRLFSVAKSSARDARSLIVSRMNYIAADNLKGLCTPGHSCKENGKILLNAILKRHPMN